MNRRITAILLFALLAAAAASLAVYRMISQKVTAAQTKSTPIVIAAHNLEIGTPIKESDLGVAEWLGTVPKGAVLKKDEAVGRGVIAEMYEGEPVLAHRLALAGAGAGLAALIPQGMRACAVKVDEVVGVAGFVVSGMRVDVLVSGSPSRNGDAAETKVRTLLQNIEVLSAGQKFQRDAEGKPVKEQVVNLLVTPEQAELLSLASSQTRIQLVLRNPLDREAANPPGSTIAEILNAPKRAAITPVLRPTRPTPVKKAEPPAEKPSVRVIEVLNGPTRTEAKFVQSSEDRPQ